MAKIEEDTAILLLVVATLAILDNLNNGLTSILLSFLITFGMTYLVLRVVVPRIPRVRDWGTLAQVLFSLLIGLGGIVLLAALLVPLIFATATFVILGSVVGALLLGAFFALALKIAALTLVSWWIINMDAVRARCIA